jgi:hypothetical protein
MQKISQSNKGRNNKENNSKPILQYDLQGNFIKEWKNGKEASLYSQIPSSDISQCCSNKKYTAGGYIWFYKLNFNIKILKQKLERLQDKYNNIKKPINQLDLNNNIINEYESYMEAKRKSKINNIESALSGRQKTAGGYKWEYKNII